MREFLEALVRALLYRLMKAEAMRRP